MKKGDIYLIILITKPCGCSSLKKDIEKWYQVMMFVFNKGLLPNKTQSKYRYNNHEKRIQEIKLINGKLYVYPSEYFTRIISCGVGVTDLFWCTLLN